MLNNKRPSPLSVRLSPEKWARLRRDAKGQSLSSYVQDRLFKGDDLRYDKKAVAQILGKLGQSSLASGFNALAEAARIGALPVTEETEAAINAACADVREIKSLLMAALRIKED